MVAIPPTTIRPLTMCGTSRMVGCTAICTASSPAPMLLSNISRCGRLCSFWSPEVRHTTLVLFSSADSQPLDPVLINNIRTSTLLIPNIRNLASSRTSSHNSSVGTPTSHRSQSQSYQDTETGEGQGEIQQLGRRIIEIIEGDEPVPGSVPSGSHMQPGTSVDSDHEELRRSVREAFAPGSHR
jgi:hypothetical protein